MSKQALQRLGYCEKALELKQEIEGHFLLLGEYLHQIKENRLYEPQWTSFEEFVFEMKMSTNTANKLIQVHKTFILSYGFTSNEIKNAGGFSLLVDVLPMVTSRKSAEKWLLSASTLTRSDLRKEITEAKTGIQMKDCEHAETYTVTICKHCGERIQTE